MDRDEIDKDTLIVANPGTGKTTSIARRVVDLLKNGVDEEDILCITFTEKASQEMQDKISKSIEKEVSLNGKNPYKIGVYTFHSYANSYLQMLGKDKDLSENNELRYSIYKSLKDSGSLNYGKDYIIDKIVPKCENAIRYLKSFGIMPDSIDLGKAKIELESIYSDEGIENVSLEETSKFMDLLVDAFKAYENEKDKENKIDYNDMLLEFMKYYNPSKRFYKHVLVDELQDVNELEKDIAMSSGKTKFLVGDKKQSIFGFQGGSISLFEDMKNDTRIKVDKRIKNYRSLQGILDYAKKVFLEHTPDSKDYDELDGLKAEREGNAEVELIVAKDQNAATVDKLREMLKEEDDQTYAIITRTNGQIISISRMLKELGIDHSTTVGGYTSSVAKKEIITYLKGLLYDNRDSIVSALFTPFSGVPLKEAFKIAEDTKYNKGSIENILNRSTGFNEIRKSLTIDNLTNLFNHIVLPISFSIGMEYYLTANSIYKSALEFLNTGKSYSREDFFSYLSITEEDYDPINKDSKIILTTVHKAKGREFDKVIYVPMKTREMLSFIDAIVYSIVKSSKGKDVREELNEENLRVDFVAFTRARDDLYVVITDKQLESYEIEGIPVKSYETERSKEPVSWKYDEAYSLFLSGDKEKAESIIKEDKAWLVDAISNYFNSTTKLSYTLLEGIKGPYDFLKKNILNVPQPKSDAMELGVKVHSMAEMRFKSGLNEGSIEDKYIPYLRNIEKIDEKIKGQEMHQISAEYQLEIPLESMFSDVKETGLSFKGKLDAVYESDKGGHYLILDWKTDKNDNESSEHRRQLAAYKRAYAIDKGISEESIEVALGFVGLRGQVDTGIINWDLDAQQPKKGQIDTFEKRVYKFIEYKRNPISFLEDLAEEKNDEPLYARIMSFIGDVLS